MHMHNYSVCKPLNFVNICKWDMVTIWVELFQITCELHYYPMHISEVSSVLHPYYLHPYYRPHNPLCINKVRTSLLLKYKNLNWKFHIEFKTDNDKKLKNVWSCNHLLKWEYSNFTGTFKTVLPMLIKQSKNHLKYHSLLKQLKQTITFIPQLVILNCKRV